MIPSGLFVFSTGWKKKKTRVGQNANHKLAIARPPAPPSPVRASLSQPACCFPRRSSSPRTSLSRPAPRPAQLAAVVPRTNVEQSSPPTVRAPTSPPACTQMLQHNLSRYIQLVPFEFLTASGLKSAGRKAVAAQGLAPGTVINHFFEPVLTRPTMHTICLGEHYHVAPTQGAEFISHACEGSNTRILVGAPQQGGKVVVTRPVAQGEDLSFNYNTTEWIMSCPFDCACASCTLSPSKRQVRGFAFLSPSERMKIYHETTPWIRSLAARSQSHTVASKHPSSAVSEQALQQQQQQ